MSSYLVSTVVFDNLENGKYSKAISLGAGLYQVIQVDHGSSQLLDPQIPAPTTLRHNWKRKGQRLNISRNIPLQPQSRAIHMDSNGQANGNHNRRHHNTKWNKWRSHSRSSLHSL